MKWVFDMEIVREAECAAAVGVWNYWDMEHPPFVHSGFDRYDVLYESKDMFLVLVKVRLPVLRFLTCTSMHCAIRDQENVFIAYSKFFGAPSQTTYTITEPRRDLSRYHMHYRIELEGWRVLLHPILRLLIPRHNKRVWEEDLALKLRRQKVMRLNFKDFSGLPDGVHERVYDGPITCSIPLPRPRNSAADASPLRRRAKTYDVRREPRATV